MAQIVVCGLIKGGTGKSTVVRNLSFALAQAGYRVCIVDDDAQANLTISCGIDNPAELPITMGQLMELEMNGEELPDPSQYIRPVNGVDLIPSSRYLSVIENRMRMEEQNFGTLCDMINASEVREDDEKFVSEVDKMFNELAQREPEHFAVRQYKKFKLAAGKTAKSILVSCGARLAPFDIAQLRDLMEMDEMDLESLGERKTALFIIISDTDDTFNFVAALLYTQLFNLLCDKADDQHGGRLPVHVRCLLDEFANIGQIPKFDKLIATIRSREISACIVLQAQSQLKTIYKDAADTIQGNCDTTLFLGGKESGTLKELSETLGKQTIDLFNTSDTRGQSRSYGLNFQKTGRELMSRDELAVLDGGKCILQLRGVRPFLSDKYDITKHPKYRQLKDADERNAFDLDGYLRCKLRLRLDETIDYMEEIT